VDTETPVIETPVKTGEPKVTVEWLPMFKVILHNDDHTPMEHVVGALMQSVPGCTRFQALRHMMTAHMTGSAVVYRADMEEAETIAARIRVIGVRVTTEPDR
jgi:ATP-dependent Clp protease adaptor protein ClpS